MFPGGRVGPMVELLCLTHSCKQCRVWWVWLLSVMEQATDTPSSTQGRVHKLKIDNRPAKPRCQWDS